MINSIFLDPNNGSTKKPELTLVIQDNPTLWETREELAGGDYDFANAGQPAAVKIKWYLETGFSENVIGALYTFHALLLRLLLISDGTEAGTSNGDAVDVTVTSMDNTTAAVADSTFTVANPPKKMYNLLLGDIVAEKVKVKLSGSNSFLLRKLILWVSEKAQTRPRN